MAGYSSYKYGINPEDDSYLYGESQDPFSASAKNYDLGGNELNSALQIQGDTTSSNLAKLGQAGLSGALAGSPMGAGIMVGGQFLSQYLGQKAAAEQAKRQRAVDIEREYTKNMGDALSQKLAAFRSALR